MCYGDDALPPPPPLSGAIGDHGELFLLAADGTEFATYYAYPGARRARSAVVVLPDARGLHRFYQELTERFASVGLLSIAIDYYGRSTEKGSSRDEGFPYRQHLDQLQPEHATLDVAAAVGWLRSDPDHDVDSVFTVGFCRGGSLSWRQSAGPHGLAGCVGFYGDPGLASDMITQMRAPLLMLAAGQDQIPVSDVERLADQVRAAGVEAELYVYPNAPHSFFDRQSGRFAEECDDAWRRMLGFIDRHSVERMGV